MPELPEVETIRLGLEPLICGDTIEAVEIREPRLRWPVEPDLPLKLEHQRVTDLTRRGKYLLISTTSGTLMVHLGMSGSLRYLQVPSDPARHDHLDLKFSSGARLRFNDPRRFGSLHFTTRPQDHWLLKNLGPEPLGPGFTAEYLWRISRRRRVAIKQHLMSGRVVAGVGNIYANEALFRARIHPMRPAGRIARQRVTGLVEAVRAVRWKPSGPVARRCRTSSAGTDGPATFSSRYRSMTGRERPVGAAARRSSTVPRGSDRAITVPAANAKRKGLRGAGPSWCRESWLADAARI